MNIPGSLMNVSKPAQEHVERSLSVPSMGGSLLLRVAGPFPAQVADRDLAMVAARVEAWARRLTRFRGDSDLSDVNRDPRAPRVQARPTLASVLDRARGLEERTEGVVDVTLLDQRLAAEEGREPVDESGDWWLEGSLRRRVVVRRGHVRFDLDGVAKGWIADRALGLLRDYPAAMVDADGDVAIRVPPTSPWQVAVADPRDDGRDLAVFDLGESAPRGRMGLATSGTSVHRWSGSRGEAHHLIDPWTGRPAATDVVQASVIAESAAAAEAMAKAAVIVGSDEGLDLLERASAWGVVLLLTSGDVIVSPQTLDWLA